MHKINSYTSFLDWEVNSLTTVGGVYREHLGYSMAIKKRYKQYRS